MFGLGKIADKNFVIGYVLPILLTVLAGSFLFRDVEFVRKIYETIINQKSFSDLTFWALAIWLVSVVLMAINKIIVRFLEGYVWPLNHSFFVKKYKDKFEARKIELKALYTANDAVSSGEYLRKFVELKANFPFKEQYVLSTEFGNALRSFETYSTEVYNFDAIPGLIRLSGVIPSSYASAIDSARSEVNFFVNLLLSASLITVLAGLRTLFDIGHLVQWDDWSQINIYEHLTILVVSVGTMRFAYKMAVQFVKAWGEYVKGAFDLYLPTLARQLGYELPKSAEDRRNFWEEMTTQFLVGKPVDPAKWSPIKPGDEPEEALENMAEDDDSESESSAEA